MRDPEASQEYRADIVGTLEPGQIIGQTFISRRARLTSIQLWVNIEPPVNNEALLIAELYNKPEDVQPLVSIVLSHQDLEGESPITITFEPRESSPGETFYIALRTTGGKILFYGRNENAYSDGNARLNAVPQTSDLAFRLSYDYDLNAIYSDIKNALKHIWLVIPILLTLWLPGRWLMEIFLQPNLNLDWGARIAISIGLSTTIAPLFLLWLSKLGLSITPAVLWWINGVMTATLILKWWIDQQRQFPFSFRPSFKVDKATISLIIIFIVSLFVRLAMVRDLVTPAWVDSVHHAVITRLIVENGGFPDTYAPYWEGSFASYHPGFHSSLAIFQWLSRIDIPQAMLLFGQVLNAMSVFAVYLFTTTLVKNRTAGVIAALITGLFTPMPAYYTSWGRYTQLIGQLIMPTCLWLINQLMILPDSQKTKTISFKAISITSIAIAGLFMAHYRVFIFFICLVIAYLISKAKPFPWNKASRATRYRLSYLSMASAGALFITFPWWTEAVPLLFLPRLKIPTAPIAAFQDFSTTYLTSALGKQAMVLAFLGLGLALLKNRRLFTLLVVWVCSLFLLANLGTLGLPGYTVINNTSVEIALFIPISTSVGFFGSWAIGWVENRFTANKKWLLNLIISLLGGILLLWGARSIIPILNPVTILYRDADRAAQNWIQENTPQDATILINPFYWGYGLHAGNDGGFWISPSTGRKTLPPPVLFALEGKGEITTPINEACKAITDKSNDPDALYSIMKDLGIEYIYLGARGGIFSPKLLENHKHFRMMYYNRGVWIFKRMP